MFSCDIIPLNRKYAVCVVCVIVDDLNFANRAICTCPKAKIISNDDLAMYVCAYDVRRTCVCKLLNDVYLYSHSSSLMPPHKRCAEWNIISNAVGTWAPDYWAYIRFQGAHKSGLNVYEFLLHRFICYLIPVISENRLKRFLVFPSQPIEQEENRSPFQLCHFAVDGGAKKISNNHHAARFETHTSLFYCYTTKESIMCSSITKWQERKTKKLVMKWTIERQND